MSNETCKKFYKIYMDKGLKEKAEAIFKGSIPEELKEVKEVIKSKKSK